MTAPLSFNDLLAGPVSFNRPIYDATANVARHASAQPDSCHNLSYVNGRAELALATDRHGSAWHKQGVEIPHGMTGEQARQLALPWEYVREGILCHDGAHIDTHVVLRRSDTRLPLSVVSSSYEVYGNGEMFQFLDSLCETGQAFYESAGALDNGRKTWALLRRPDAIEVLPGDKHIPYVCVLNSCDGTRGLRILPTYVRVVCNNTYTAADRSAEGFSIRHTKNMRDRVAVAGSALSFVAKSATSYAANMQSMVKAEMDAPTSRALFAALLNSNGDAPIKPISGTEMAVEMGRLLADRLCVSRTDFNTTYRALRPSEREAVDEMTWALRSEKNTLSGMEGTAYAAFQAFTDWTDHRRTVRGNDSAGEKRFASNMVGAAHGEKVIASAAVLAYASAKSN